MTWPDISGNIRKGSEIAEKKQRANSSWSNPYTECLSWTVGRQNPWNSVGLCPQKTFGIAGTKAPIKMLIGIGRAVLAKSCATETPELQSFLTKQTSKCYFTKCSSPGSRMWVHVVVTFLLLGWMEYKWSHQLPTAQNKMLDSFDSASAFLMSTVQWIRHSQ